MSRVNLFLFFCLHILLTNFAYAGWFGPKDYDECIIEGMNGIQSNVAARLVRQSCLKKFPPQKAKTSKSTRVPIEIQENLSGRASILLSNLSGNIYNGNSDWTITELIIMLSEENSFEKSLEALKNNKSEPRMDKYKIEVNIPPYTNKDFFISVDWPKGEPYEWHIYEAYGYK